MFCDVCHADFKHILHPGSKLCSACGQQLSEQIKKQFEKRVKFQLEGLGGSRKNSTPPAIMKGNSKSILKETRQSIYVKH